MTSGVSKARTHRSRVQLSKALQETLLDAVAGSITELPRSDREQSPESGDPTRDTTPVQARKRGLDATENDPSPAKRARLIRPDAQQPGIDDKQAEQAGKATLQQPKPNLPKHPCASFLKDFVEPVHPAPGSASVHTFVHLHHSDDVPISRQLTRSAPEIGCTRDANGFVVPPASSYRAIQDSASSTASVRHPSYRRNNLSAKSSLMSSHLIPNNPESLFRVFGPRPDLLYEYSGALGDGAFTQPQFFAQTSLHPQNTRFAEATTQCLRFPFFAIEFKAAGGTCGDLWVATNQCAGAASACLNAVDQLNISLPKHPSMQHIDNLSYSLAVDNNTAQLYISWKEDDLNYYL
ncbi:uncharacterized protein F4812DRAFT_461248 [Daldinia caldariorum]|uniref:uncharacterized protein n=1 Tax=Daldinia caldariorum TaxID=326644 RepID=UPI002007B7E9|nr:uncharacterized protein F4812DRAFT_461248 [Daldinia caldariorum]KAI1465556.1 hypothetical protein F4812DRAFT_461248 [Daldinia caldariorum]